MPTAKKNWCAHPCHLETLVDGAKKCTKFGPKPTHPIGIRRISLALANYINQTCPTILNNPLLKVNENHLLCRKCFEKETSRFQDINNEELNMHNQKVNIDENLNRDYGEEEAEDLPDLMESKRDYAIKKLNEVFRMFNIEPVVP
jgi:hypothetical protein